MRTPFALTFALGLMVQGALAQDLAFAPGADARFHWDSYDALKATRLEGQTITVLGPWLGPDKALFESVLAYFEAATGAEVVYAGSTSFEQQIVIDAEAGSPPDIAAFPQPGLAADMARKGYLRPLAAGMEDWLRENYAQGETWAQYGRYPGPDGTARLYAFPYKADVKSLVWYVPENFADAGYEVPQTLADLKTLTERIARDGGTPWCIGIASGGATGWPATDWVEDLMLRLNAPADYDAWVANRLKFDDPKVIAAIGEFGWFAARAGSGATVAATDFRDSPKGLFTVPPRCYLHRQGSFIPSFFPEGQVIGADYDVFYFPADGAERPVLVATSMFAKMTDNPDSDAFIAFLQSPIAHEVWMAQTGFVTPHRGVNPEVYGSPVLRGIGDILLSATTVRFDGSDLMPGAIGAGAFWTGMVDFVGGKPATEVARQIQAVWDTLGR
ncbi:ABC transporter substrate-binding protein [Paenirhodobacter sp.]|uniref:ABC transporter substrate-binding protein n=1 Tax=Paenirhodobacter sp. TaxID=1965326 RepID=UPI003B3E4260